MDVAKTFELAKMGAKDLWEIERNEEWNLPKEVVKSAGEASATELMNQEIN
jgi:hypothetical protein